jgi:predicted MFS family arabinose efflux permease
VIRDRVTSFLGLRRDVVLLLGAIVLISTGEETWMRFVPKYLDVLGASVFVIGLFDALKTLLGALYAYPGGVLADAWGHRRALLVFTWLSLAGYATVFFVGHWGGVLAGMFLFLGWSNLSLPALFSVWGGNYPFRNTQWGLGCNRSSSGCPS